jgi:hypothetical protein
MDQNILEQKGLGFQMREDYFLLQPNTIIPNKLREQKCGRRWEKEKRPRLVKQI